MQVATILPIPHLNLERDNHYHMALAHLVERDQAYTTFFRQMSDRGDFVLMDNGVVETGEAMPIDQIMFLAKVIRPTEIVLPDKIYDMGATLAMASQSLKYVRSVDVNIRVLAVPQGATPLEWAECCNRLLDMGVDSIGISRFVSKYFYSRLEALTMASRLLHSGVDIHLLGCPNDPHEVAATQRGFNRPIRGVDSGVAAMYTQVGLRMDGGEPKPDMKLDFTRELDMKLLKDNVEYWRDACRGKITYATGDCLCGAKGQVRIDVEGIWYNLCRKCHQEHVVNNRRAIEYGHRQLGRDR